MDLAHRRYNSSAVKALLAKPTGKIWWLKVYLPALNALVQCFMFDAGDAGRLEKTELQAKQAALKAKNAIKDTENDGAKHMAQHELAIAKHEQDEAKHAADLADYKAVYYFLLSDIVAVRLFFRFY